ncbi:Crp/Fnr family transcriptional regulator [Crateriforma conspicua]|uniref:cAMP receptor protein n=1 Tax=Crateriforma conspicua TaxID=2527996 RepID=A0A5C5Y5E0_9PLAN|nr:Crp/Fnr family transcriptional regulator [Crateriforma conspicua]QDV62528.1 cAMP receptor protein [Crateriforma conspicua]TWT68662.1 cAMP receptor protein [Crateriforma conspicua]
MSEQKPSSESDRIANDQPLERVILGCPLFAGLGPANIRSLALAARIQDFAAGELIFRQGEQCAGVYIVETGVVRVYCRGGGGQEHVLHLCGPGQSFAEVAVFADFDLPANAASVEATRCLFIPAEIIQDQIATNHDFCRQMLASMAFWTRHFTDLLSDIVLRDASDRILSYLQSLPRDATGIVDLPGPKKHIANHLDLTSETFSRTLRSLADRGHIEITSGRGIRIINT